MCFFKTGNDDRICVEVLGSGRAAVFEVLADAALLAVGAVADKGENEAQATVVRGLKSIVDVLESLRIEFAQPGLDAEIAADTVAQGLRTDDAGAHGLGGVHGVVDFKMAGIPGTHGVDGAVGFHAKPFNVGTAVAKGFAAKGQAGSVALDKFVVVLGLPRTPGTQCNHGQSHKSHSSECAPQ